MILRGRAMQWLPEFLVAAVALFFALRELSTFPSVWADDGLFTMVARSVASGQGYALHILGEPWPYPYLLAVGPTLILPVALAVKIFGFSVAISRLPMVDYLLGSCILLYLFTRRTAGRTPALWATLLLVTLSAFVNNGKPVLGEVPGLFFLLAGLLLLERSERSMPWSAVCGACFGLAVVTKLTYGLVYPALGIAALLALLRGDRRSALSLTMVTVVAIAVFLPWRLLEASYHTGLSKEFAFLFGAGGIEDSAPFAYLLGQPARLLRLHVVAYALIALLGTIGMVTLRTVLPRALLSVTSILIVLFTLYFLSSFGWYRHLLPAHALLLPFVATGAMRLLGRRTGVLLLAGIVLLQGLYQLDHRGSKRSPDGALAAQAIIERFADTDLIVRQSEIFVRLPENPRWLFLTNPLMTQRMPPALIALDARERCMPVVVAVKGAELEALGERAERLAGSYHVVHPPADCAVFTL